MAETRYKVQTWVRKNGATLAELGGPINDLAAATIEPAIAALLANPNLDVWDEVELDSDDMERIRRTSRGLSDAAARMHRLPTIPDPVCGALLATAIDAYRRAGDLGTADQIDTKAWVAAMHEAGDAFERFAAEVVSAAT